MLALPAELYPHIVPHRAEVILADALTFVKGFRQFYCKIFLRAGIHRPDTTHVTRPTESPRFCPTRSGVFALRR